MDASTPAATIQDYILDRQPNAYVNTDQYTVVLQNNTDFIISRKTSKFVKELVMLVSQNLFYFKEQKNGNIEEVTLSKLKTYFRDLKDESLSLEQVLWLPVLNKDTIERLYLIISSETYVDMCRHNLLANVKNPDWYTKYWEQNSKLFIQLYSMYPTIGDGHTNKYRSSFPIIFEIDKRYGYNEAVYFAETLLKSGAEQYTSSVDGRIYNYNGTWDEGIGTKGFLQLLNEPYNLSLRRLVEYIFFDAYAQGFSSIDSTFWKTYEDYLSMQIKIYGKIKEKYPKHLRTEHDIMALKINKMEVIAKCENFAERSAEITSLSYNGKVYSIVVPDSPQQIADEGVNLAHCVGSYVDRIIKGDCHILFLRKSHAQDESLVTLQYCNGRINQAEGLHRRNISPDERKFLFNWGKEKDVQIAI